MWLRQVGGRGVAEEEVWLRQAGGRGVAEAGRRERCG